MRKFPLLAIALFLAGAVQAQNKPGVPANEFAFASRSSLGVDASQRLPGDSLKYRRALGIYNKLVAARGDYRYAIPDFVMTRDEQKVAWLNFDRLEVGIEEKAYDVCMTFGPDADAALAQLLGHELSHYYEKHNWRRDFARQFKDLAVGAQLGVMTQADSVFNETQADYLGGFLAYSAGFPVFDQGAALTGALYRAYQLPDALRIYPVLAERQKLNERSAQLLDKLVNVYEMANL
ncbi:MAG: M48 family metalloprotease, partial [Saprospiraceae bacterium]